MHGRSFVALASCLLWSLASPALAESSFEQEIRLLTQFLELRPGAVVADIGAGEGRYAIALARSVGREGRVIATELDEEKRAEITTNAQEAGADRVEVARAEIAATGLSPACCDAVYLRDVYHHLTEPKAIVADLFRAIRPGGRLVLIDFPPTIWLALFTPEGIPDDRGGHGIRPELLIEETTAAGFRVVERIDEWPSSNFVTRTYGVVFERPKVDRRPGLEL